MKGITSANIAIARMLAAGLGVAESGIGATTHHPTADASVLGYANRTVNDLLRM